MANIQLQNYLNAFNNLPLQAKIGNHTVETYTYKNIAQRCIVVQINPTTAIASNILQGAQIDYKIESGVLDRIGGAGVQLRIAYANTSGAACVVSTADNFIQQVQI
jgi:hypothetical protein